MKLRQSNYAPRRGLASADIHYEAHNQIGEIESSVESVGKRAQVVIRVLGVFEGLVGAGQHGLEVAKNGVDPLELRQVAGLALAHNFGVMRTASFGDGCEACQTVAVDAAAWREVGLGPLRDSLAGEGGHRYNFDVDGIALIVERDRRDERHLVFGASARFAASALAAEVRVVELHSARQAMDSLSCSHRRHDLVMNQPCGRIAHANLALEIKRRQTRLGLTDQIDSQEPGGQRQLGAGKQRAGGRRHLVMAGVALEAAPRQPTDDAVSAAVATWAVKTFRPPRPFDRRAAGGLRTKTPQECGQRHARLELDEVA